MASTFLNQGKVIDELEDVLAGSSWNLSLPVTLNSCTASLFLALKLSNIGPDDDVLIPAQTFIATGLSVLMVGARPRFVDIDNNGNMDIDDLKSKLTTSTKAVIVVHWGGWPADLEKISKICKDRDIKLIEDAAHAFGAQYKLSAIGDCQYSDFCTFSLQAIKSLTAGDGGILCCANHEDYERAIRLRWFGIDKQNVVRNENGARLMRVTELGYKLHMHDFNGALALGNLDGLQNRLRRRRQIATRYYSELMFTDVILNSCQYSCKPSFWLFPIKVEKRDDLIKKLISNGIQASVVDTRIDENQVFGYKARLPNQEIFENTQLHIPCTSGMTDEEQTKIIDTIKSGW